MSSRILLEDYLRTISANATYSLPINGFERGKAYEILIGFQQQNVASDTQSPIERLVNSTESYVTSGAITTMSALYDTTTPWLGSLDTTRLNVHGWGDRTGNCTSLTKMQLYQEPVNANWPGMSIESATTRHYSKCSLNLGAFQNPTGNLSSTHIAGPIDTNSRSILVYETPNLGVEAPRTLVSKLDWSGSNTMVRSNMLEPLQIGHFYDFFLYIEGVTQPYGIAAGLGLGNNSTTPSVTGVTQNKSLNWTQAGNSLTRLRGQEQDSSVVIHVTNAGIGEFFSEGTFICSTAATIQSLYKATSPGQNVAGSLSTVVQSPGVTAYDQFLVFSYNSQPMTRVRLEVYRLGS